jgi:hypothetical protein
MLGARFGYVRMASLGDQGLQMCLSQRHDRMTQ